MTILTQLPLEDLTTLAFGGTAGWLLLYLCGQFGAVADRVAVGPEAGVKDPAGTRRPRKAAGSPAVADA